MKTITSTLALTFTTVLLAGCFLTDDKDSNGNDENTVTVRSEWQDSLNHFVLDRSSSTPTDTLGLGFELFLGGGGLDPVSGIRIEITYRINNSDSTRVAYWIESASDSPHLPPDTIIIYPGYPCTYAMSGDITLNLGDTTITTQAVFDVQLTEWNVESVDEEVILVIQLILDEEASSPEGFDSVNFAGRPFNGTLFTTCPLP